MHFIEHQERRLRAPALTHDDGAVAGNVVIQILAAALRDQGTAQRGLADLARAGQEHHFAGQVGLDAVIKITFHTRILRLNERTLLFSRDF